MICVSLVCPHDICVSLVCPHGICVSLVCPHDVCVILVCPHDICVSLVCPQALATACWSVLKAKRRLLKVSGVYGLFGLDEEWLSGEYCSWEGVGSILIQAAAFCPLFLALGLWTQCLVLTRGKTQVMRARCWPSLIFLNYCTFTALRTLTNFHQIHICSNSITSTAKLMAFALMTIMYIYNVLTNALSSNMIPIKLKTIFYNHIE